MAPQYAHLLSPKMVRGFVFKNRMLSANSLPHFLQGPEEYPAQSVITHYGNRAKSGAAAVAVGGVNNFLAGKQFPMDMDIGHFVDWNLYQSQCQNYLAQLADVIHYHQSIAELCFFVGPQAFYPLKKKAVPEVMQGNFNGDTGDKTKPFDIPLEDSFELEQIPAHMLPHEYDMETLEKIADSYAEQCAIARYLDFDMVNIHMCYRGNLPGKFFSPLTNFRTDDFGGSLENRMRFPLMVLKRVREAIGPNAIFELQWSTVDTEGGYGIEDTVAFLNAAKKYIDIVQLRGADADPSHPTGFNLNPYPYLEDAAYIKAHVPGLLVSTIGGYLEPEVLDRSIAEGKFDFVSMARAWISNPEYGKLVLEGRGEDIVPCLRCNKCHGRGPHDPLVSVCSVNPTIGIEHYLKDMVSPVERKKKVAVVGGGPGGMRCAIFLSERGHDVTLFEAEDTLGGAIRHADFVSFKWPLRHYKDYLIHQVTTRENIRVELNCPMTPERLSGMGFDAVVVSVGAHPVVPEIPGLKDAKPRFAVDAMMEEESFGRRVVIIGGGEVGVEAAMHLAEKGHDATVLEMKEMLASDTTKIHYRSMFREAWEKLDGFHGLTGVTVTGVDEEGVHYTDRDGDAHVVPADSVLVAVGMKAETEEALKFYGVCPEFYLVGDCRKPGTIQQTNRSAFAVANRI